MYHTRQTLSRRGLLAAAASIPFAHRAWAAGSGNVDVAVIGASTGGVAAALAALRVGARVLLTEETDWIGGQLTSQLVPPDEHPWIEHTGATRLYREYRNAVRAYYRSHYPLTADARATPFLNPGNGSVSRIAHEPRVSLEVLEAMLQPYLSSGQLTLLLRHQPLRAEVAGNRIRRVTLRALDTGALAEVEAAYFLDATDHGDLLPLTGTEYVTGAESRSQTGEPTAPETAQPHNIQAFTVCFALGHREGEDHTIEKPAQYAFWRDYVPAMQPAWPGKLLSLTYSHPVTLEPRTLSFDPTRDAVPGSPLNLWVYRRIRDRRNFTDTGASSSISLINWPQNDYLPGRIHEQSDTENAKHLEEAKQLSLSLLYWLQTEAPRPDGGQGWKGLELRTDVSGTADGLAKYPYIRESRRIRAEYTVTEREVGSKARAQITGLPEREVRAETFADSVGVGSYRIDLHPSTGGDNYIDISSLPFQIPLGALIPQRVENLIAACKNIGVTHLTNGCYRLHPVEWNIGESAGYLAGWCVAKGILPREVRNQKAKLEEFQREITRQGVELQWPQYTAR
ncbi:MAG: FAD-dependent oxidoreductase [Bryobacterales bacterium]|nr:FAD-dependent oxidoreductase [Bryobacterales bacterium]